MDQFEEVVPQIIPKDPFLSAPQLFHADLNPSNIFISKHGYKSNHISISSIIDWQHTAMLPLYLVSKMPQFLECQKSYLLPTGLGTLMPTEEELSSMDEDERKETLQDIVLANRHKLYKMYTHHHSSAYHAALFPSRKTRGVLSGVVHATHTLGSVGYSLLMNNYIRLSSRWKELDHRIEDGNPIPECPIEVPEDIDDIVYKLVASAKIRSQTFDELNEMLGCNPDGWITHDHYWTAVMFSGLFKKDAIERQDEGLRELIETKWLYVTLRNVKV